jgi:hypothetical protein
MVSTADDSVEIAESSSSAYSSYFDSAFTAKVSMFNIYPAVSMLDFFRILTLLSYFKPVLFRPEASILRYYAAKFSNLSMAKWRLS